MTAATNVEELVSRLQRDTARGSQIFTTPILVRNPISAYAIAATPAQVQLMRLLDEIQVMERNTPGLADLLRVQGPNASPDPAIGRIANAITRGATATRFTRDTR